MALAPFVIRWPGQLVFGDGVFATLGREAAALGRRALLIVPHGSGLAERAAHLLEEGDLDVERFDLIGSEATIDAVDEAAAMARKAGCDLLVAIGGGEVIDLAKGAAVAATHDGDIRDYAAGGKPIGATALAVLAVPTVAGAGAEVAMTAILVDRDAQRRVVLRSPHLFPRTALVDPELTHNLSGRATVMAGFDVLARGLQAFLCANHANPVTDALALEAIGRAAANLPRVLEKLDDRDARAQMSMAAVLAGTAAAEMDALPAGPSETLALSRLLPAAIEAWWPKHPDRYAAAARRLAAAPSDAPVEQQAAALGPWLRRFVEAVGLDKLWKRRMDAAFGESITDDTFAGSPGLDERQIKAMLDRTLGDRSQEKP